MGTAYNKYQGCTRKKAHNSLSAANKFIRRQDGGAERFRTYECGFCHCWHVATRGKGAERDKATRLSIGLSA